MYIYIEMDFVKRSVKTAISVSPPFAADRWQNKEKQMTKTIIYQWSGMEDNV